MVPLGAKAFKIQVPHMWHPCIMAPVGAVILWYPHIVIVQLK